MISFALDETQRLIQETARKLAAERLWPAVRETESARALPDALLAEAHELGLTTLDLPEEHGGGGLGLTVRCLVEEELAWGDAGACFALAGPGTLGPFLVELGTPGQQGEVLGRFARQPARRGAVAFGEPRPAARPGLSTVARRDGDGWVLTGDKSFVVNGGIADDYLVIAQVEPDAGWDGLGAFLVPADTAGVHGGERRKSLGLDAAHIADVRFEDVRVPEDAQLTGAEEPGPALVRAFARVALVNAARAVGAARRAFELAHEYCGERKAFGKPIGHFQAVAFTVADRLMDVDGARWMVWRAAAEWDGRGKAPLGRVAAAAAHALLVAQRCGDDGVQLFGGAGFIRDYPIEKLFRDARQLSLMGPTVESLGQLLAHEELGLPPDPAAVLPTSDIQPICL